MKINGFLICIMILIFVGIASVDTVYAECKDLCLHEERGSVKSETFVLRAGGIKSDRGFEEHSEFWKNWEKRNQNTCVIRVQVLSEIKATGWNQTEIYCCIYYHDFNKLGY